MSQQINLINPSLIKKKDLFTTANISTVYLCVGALMLAWFFNLKRQVEPLQTKQTQVAQQLIEAQQALSNMQQARNPQINEQLTTTIKALESKQMQQAIVIDHIGSRQSDTHTGVASYMRSLARQTVKDVWLTGFSIDAAQHAVNLTGKSLQADLLPGYMQKLGKAAVFKGQSFGGLQIKTPVLDLSQHKSSAGDVAPILEPTAKPSYVEFELQAHEDDSALTNRHEEGQT